MIDVDALANRKQNQEIVERLKKRIEYLDGWKGIISDYSQFELYILQKILGEKE